MLGFRNNFIRYVILFCVLEARVNSIEKESNCSVQSDSHFLHLSWLVIKSYNRRWVISKHFKQN